MQRHCNPKIVFIYSKPVFFFSECRIWKYGYFIFYNRTQTHWSRPSERDRYLVHSYFATIFSQHCNRLCYLVWIFVCILAIAWVIFHISMHFDNLHPSENNYWMNVEIYHPTGSSGNLHWNDYRSIKSSWGHPPTLKWSGETSIGSLFL